MTIVQRFTEGTVFKFFPEEETQVEKLFRVENRNEKELALRDLLQSGEVLKKA